MPNFTVDQIRDIMGDQDNIRNISVIAHSITVNLP
jgi:hypothetical protein